MDSKGLGIIGGMGPKATSVFFDKIIENTDAHKDQDHLNIVILNHATLPDRTDAILNDREEEFLGAIKKDFKLLEMAEVSNIAIPCNTSHYFYDKMQKMTDIHIINMVEETIKVIAEKYGSNTRVGMMATNGTIKSDVYKKVGLQYGLELHYPAEEIQEKIMDIIYNKVKSNLPVDEKEMEELVHHFIDEAGCSCVILACTELSVLKLTDEIAPYCVDAMEVLVQKSIELSGKQVKNDIDQIFEESFSDDVYVREFRLSQAELEYAKKKYPHAEFKMISSEEDTDQKVWVEINRLPDNKNEKPNQTKTTKPNETKVNV